MTALTEPQKRALLWLPENGEWRRYEYPVADPLFEFLWDESPLVERKWDDPLGYAYRLTPAGLAERAKLAGGGE